MAAQNRYIKRHLPPNITREPSPLGPTRSYARFLCKSLFFALFLVGLPLFPSQAPDFINQTIFTKFWELLHLLVVGIAVSYGLFSRRHVDRGIDFRSNVDDSQSYVSRMFHDSSIFEDGCENSCGFDEKNGYQTLRPRYHKAESQFDESNGSSVLDELNKPGSFNVAHGFEDPCAYDGSNVIQAWNSQYFQGEPMIVVAQPKYGLNENTCYKPLGLPVRSLRSRVRIDTPEFSNTKDSGSSVNGSFKGSSGSINRKVCDFGPANLEENFNETVPAPSPIPWPSRSTMEMRENVGAVTHPSHFRPLSVDESQFESLKFRSLQSTESSSSRTSSMSHSPDRPSPSHSASSESSNSNIEEFEKEMRFRQSYSLTSPSPSPPTPLNRNASMSLSSSRHNSHGSLLEEDMRRNSEDDLKHLRASRRNDPLDRKGWGSSPSKLGAQEWEKENCSGRSSPPTSPAPQANGEASVSRLHSRHYSHGSLEDDTRRNFEGDLWDLSGSRRRNSLGRRERGSSSLKLGLEGYGKEKSFHESYPPSSASLPINSDASINAMHPRHDSHGTFSERDMRRRFKDDFEDLSTIRGKDSSDSKERRSGSLKWESKPASLAKASSRGKSVRTIRGSGYTREAIKDAKMHKNQIDEKIGSNPDAVEAVYMGKSEFMSGGVDNLSIGTIKQNLVHGYPAAELTTLEDQKRRKQEFSENSAVEDSKSEAEDFQVSSKEEALPDTLSEASHDPDEVDKKAGEFIAKFREQIRLQKMAYVETPRGLNFGDNYFR